MFRIVLLSLHGNTLELHGNAIFNWVSKVLRYFIPSAPLSSMPGPEKLRHPLNQPDAKSKINCSLLWQLTYIHFEITWVHVPFSLVFFWSYIVIKLVQFCSVTTYHTGHLADHHDKCCHAAVISHISLRWALYQTFRCFRAIQFGSDLTRK